MKKMLLVILFLGILIHSKADEKYSPDINGLYEATLIITCNATQSVEGKVLFTVLNILKNTSSQEVKPNTLIQFYRPRYGALGGYRNGSLEGDFIVYLRQYKGEWFCYGGSQQVHELEEGKIPFTLCGKMFLYTPQEYRRLKKHFYTTFYNEDGIVYRAYLTEAEYRKVPDPEEAVLHMYTCQNNKGRYYANQVILEPPIEEVTKISEEIEEDTTIYSIPEIAPIYPGGEKAMYNYIQLSITDSMRNNPNGIEGNIYVQFVIEKDGSITQTKVLRGIGGGLDEEAIRIVEEMPEWAPGMVQEKPVRMTYIIPIRIRKD
jgi:hypothetical protein